MQRAAKYSNAFFIALACSALPVHACMNDRDSDSLAEEGRDLPDVVRVVTGRFERNPPLFYQMRIARVQQELQSQPRAFNLYDDISVAFDRLGKSDEAIRWIEKKRSHLPPFNAQDRVLKEHWYRYHANVGTFQAHRWLRAGADRKKIVEMVRARDHIRRAIHIKPNAHFGREKFQLAAMNWIIELGEYQDIRHGFLEGANFKKTPKQAIEGLTGLIVLGNAWESVDVFYALSQEIQKDDRRSSLSYTTYLRVNELIDNGKSSLSLDAPQGADLKKLLAPRDGFHNSSVNKEEIKNAYKTLRAEAEQWQAARTKYVIARLQTGRHPDTDKTFWNEYSNAEPSSLEQLTPRYSPSWWRHFLLNWPTMIILFLPLSIVFIPFLFLLRWIWRSWRHKPSTNS